MIAKGSYTRDERTTYGTGATCNRALILLGVFRDCNYLDDRFFFSDQGHAVTFKRAGAQTINILFNVPHIKQDKLIGEMFLLSSKRLHQFLCSRFETSMYPAG